MKCLSLKQPFAFLLASGKKTIELRKWNTHFRGEFLIHSSKTIDFSSCKRLLIDCSNTNGSITTGSIIGSAILIAVKKYTCENNSEFEKDKDKHFSTIEKYYEGYKYGFLIGISKLFKNPIKYPGMLRFFEVDKSIIDLKSV